MHRRSAARTQRACRRRALRGHVVGHAWEARAGVGGHARWRARTAGVPETNPSGSVAGRRFGEDPLESDRVVLHFGHAQPKHAPLGPLPRVLVDGSMRYPELRLVVGRESSPPVGTIPFGGGQVGALGSATTGGEGAASDWCLRVEVGSCKGIVETNAGSCDRSPLHATKSYTAISVGVTPFLACGRPSVVPVGDKLASKTEAWHT